MNLQARHCCASADSRVVHIAEVMIYLNQHTGAGLTVPFDPVLLTLLGLFVSPGELLAMKKNEMKELVVEEKQESNECSKSVATLSLRKGKPCMGTNIHTGVPNSTSWDGFFFDHEYTAKCHTGKAKNPNACVGSAYFKYDQKFHVFFTYACERDGNKCHFHDYAERILCKKSDESDHVALAHFTMFCINELKMEFLPKTIHRVK